MTRYILAIDPGLATGVAFFSWEDGADPVLVKSWETQMETFPEVVRWALKNYPTTEVVCERFTITQETAKKSQAPFSLEHIGMLKLMLMDAGRKPTQFALQTPLDAKKMFPNAAIKKLGYWHKGGAGHALDAIRHGLLYAVHTGWSAKGLVS